MKTGRWSRETEAELREARDLLRALRYEAMTGGEHCQLDEDNKE